MQTELTRIKKTASTNKATNSDDAVIVANSVPREQHNVNPKMGTGSCTICDCSEFMPGTGTGDDPTCINENSEGGTCNHYKSEHNESYIT